MRYTKVICAMGDPGIEIDGERVVDGRPVHLVDQQKFRGIAVYIGGF